MNRPGLLAGFLLVAMNAFAAEPTTLDQAVAIAIENNANVRNAQLEVERGETRVAAARTRRLPSLKFEMVGGEALNNLSIKIKEGELGTFENTGPLPNHDTRIDLARTFSMIGITRITQPLTQLHSIGLGIQLKEVSLAVDKEQQRAARHAVTREVKSAYFAVLSARSYSAAMQEAVTTWEEVDREMNVRVAQKVVLEADRLDASARLAATRVAALSAANSLATAQDRLNYLVGKEIEVTDLDSPLPTAWGEGRVRGDASRGFESRPDVREAALQVEQARLGVKLKSAENIPEVALMVSNATPFNNDVLPRNMTSAGITMSYEPFTWGRRKAELAERRHAVAQAENVLRDRQAAAGVEIAARRRKVEEASAQIAVRRLEAEASRERLRVVKAKFQVQAARPDEMFEASASITQAAAREQEAISAYWTALADYEKAIGEE
jgi:outer membrane protein TolC